MDGLQLSNQNPGWMTAQYALTVVKTGGCLIKHARYYWFGAIWGNVAALPSPAG